MGKLPIKAHDMTCPDCYGYNVGLLRCPGGRMCWDCRYKWVYKFDSLKMTKDNYGEYEKFQITMDTFFDKKREWVLELSKAHTDYCISINNDDMECLNMDVRSFDEFVDKLNAFRDRVKKLTKGK